MRENEAKLLASHGAVREARIVRSGSGARASSRVAGWVCSINGEPLASARRPQRVFASLDTAAEALSDLGIARFSVDCSEVEASVPE